MIQMSAASQLLLSQLDMTHLQMLFFTWNYPGCAIAKKAMNRKTGARGLRSILEGVLLETMYELPSVNDVSKVVIDESVINGESQPLLIYSGNESQAAGAE